MEEEEVEEQRDEGENPGLAFIPRSTREPVARAKETSRLSAASGDSVESPESDLRDEGKYRRKRRKFADSPLDEDWPRGQKENATSFEAVLPAISEMYGDCFIHAEAKFVKWIFSNFGEAARYTGDRAHFYAFFEKVHQAYKEAKESLEARAESDEEALDEEVVKETSKEREVARSWLK